MTRQFCAISKMDEIDKTKLTEQTKIRINKLIKYVTTFDYIDKVLIVLSATNNGVSIISFASVVGAPVRIASASFTLIFFSNNRNNQKITKHNKKQKEKGC